LGRGCEADNESGRYGRLFARAMQFRQQRCLYLEQIRYQLTDKNDAALA
jgi:hypothetical protein